MRLKQITKTIPEFDTKMEVPDIEIKDICIDSRKAKKADLFVALKGCNKDGRTFIRDAVSKGVNAVMLNRNNRMTSSRKDIVYLPVRNTRTALRKIVKKIFTPSSSRVKVLGVTGTNGKTTISYLLESFFKAQNKSCGIIGTVNHRYGGKTFVANNTTPSYLDNHKMLKEMAKKRVRYCVMEVSSHALDQRRVEDIDFKTAIFTNLTNDHLDYHKTLNHYFASKAKLFTNLSPEGLSIINKDDAYGRKLISRVKSRIVTYGIKNSADIMAKDIYLGVDGSSFSIVTPQGDIFVKTQLIGLYNIYNILAATAAALNEKVSLKTVQKVLRRFRSVPGRLEKVKTKLPSPVFIDYAHTPDALLNVLKALRAITSKKIMLVFGCGGDRDKSKRPLMGEIASQYADYTIVTSDNPRSENPKAIIQDIVKGFRSKRFLVIVNRKKAICKALKDANSDTLVLIAGKGHEDYQILKDKRISFNEKKIIQDCINAHFK